MMFNKLRNKLIIINVLVTSVVILIVFTTIYISAIKTAGSRPPIPDGLPHYSNEMNEIITDHIEREKDSAAKQLLLSLVVSGVIIEIVVIAISYFLANEAIKPVREAYESQKNFIANASHEIKTPLAAISANLEAAAIKNNKWINNVEKETEKLTILNNELLELARTDLITETAEEEADLNRLIEDALKSFEPRMKKISLTTELAAHDKSRLAATDFVQIFNILVDNAIKYCENTVKIVLTNHELVVSNDGKMISEQDLARVFERFYQTDKTTEGVGLGLSIAQSIAKRNDWNLTVESKKNLTSFCLKF